MHRCNISAMCRHAEQSRMTEDPHMCRPRQSLHYWHLLPDMGGVV